ncbi:MAG: cobaltochelatase subunit CobN, partial [Armatimonadetes bacterium]|nr:cobaltochelatase subunit CobN [Armatimonadota bacterium]
IPPPHQYLAFYAWLNKNFHAVVHLGCRGSYEWLPGKESALRPFHYPETVIGALPSIYLYLADDGGESTLAKRRGLAVVVDHLVPPLERVNLSGEPARPEQAIIPNGLHVYGREWSKERIAFHGLTMFPSLTELLARARGLNEHQPEPDLREEVDRLAQNLALGLLSGKTPLQLVADLAVDQAVYPGLDDALAAELSRVLNQLDGHFQVVRESFAAEKEQLLRALNGSYILPGAGGEPIKNPASLPTGRNLYHLPRAFLPTREAWQAGAELAGQLLAGHPPEKVAVFLGDGDEGVSLAFGLRLLGVSPVWDENSVVSRVYPLEAPAQQQVDVLFIAAPGLDQIPALLDEALKIALAQSYHPIASLHPDLLVSLDSALATVSQGVYGSKSLAQNIFARNWVETARQLIARGISREEAGKLALIRVFGLPWGVYENRLPAAVQRTGTWDTPARLADLYLQNTSSAYGENVAGYARPDLFREHLKGIEQIYFSQTSHLFGVLDTDKGFANAGGLALAVQRIKGEAAPVSVINGDYQVESLNQYLEKELWARYFNPLWIKGMMAFDFSGAHAIADFVFNLFGWQVVGQDVIQNWMWDELKAVYIDDKYNIGVSQWLQNGSNAYSLIGILGTMMVAAQKGFWRVDEDTLKQLAELWAKLIIQMEPALCPVCEDFDLLMWALGYIDPALLDKLLKIIGEVVDKEIEVPGKEKPRPPGSSGGTRQKEPEAPKPLALPPEPEFPHRVPEPFEFIPPELEWRLAWETPDLSPFTSEEIPARAQSSRPDLAQSSSAPPAPAPKVQETTDRMQTKAAVPQEGPGGAKKVTAYEVEEVRPGVKGHLPLLGLAGVAVMFLLGVAGFFIQRAKRM